MDNPVTTGKRRVVMLANAGHKPLDTRIFHKEARSLQKAGWNVTLIIPHTEDFKKDDVEIISVPLPRKGWEQLIRCPWNIFRKALWQPASSIFHIHDSELLFVGLLLRILGRKVIYDAHEDTPLQISYQHWIPNLIKGPYILMYRVLEKLAGWFFNRIIVAEPIISRYFPVKKVTLIRNFPIAGSFKDSTDYRTRDNTLIYVGLLSKPRGLVEMLEGHSIASQKLPIELILGGKFAPASLEREYLSKYKVQYRSWLPYDEMIKALFQAKVGIIVPHPIERYKTNYPVKMFEYMAAGLPVIASREGESATFIKECDGGILVDPTKPQEIADAIVKLFENSSQAEEMGKRGRQLIFDLYNWEKESEKLLELYNAFK